MTEDQTNPAGIPQIQIKIEIEGKAIDRDINQDLRIDPENLDEALVKQPALFAYYASLTQQTNLLLAKARFDYDKKMAEHLREAREELSGSHVRVTDKQLQAVIDTQPVILAAKKRVLELEHQSQLMWAIVKALEHKRECLMQLCNNRRKEMEHLGLRVLSKVNRGDPPLGASD